MGLARPSKPPLTFANTLGWTQLQWDAPAGQLIHGQSQRYLPDFVLEGAAIRPGGDPALEITLYADGVAPKHITQQVGTKDQP